jgi:hypothetical protein
MAGFRHDNLNDQELLQALQRFHPKDIGNTLLCYMAVAQEQEGWMLDTAAKVGARKFLRNLVRHLEGWHGKDNDAAN